MGRALAQATEYAEDVIADRTIAGRKIHLACQRFLDDREYRERKGFKWSDERADHALEFFESLRHYQGDWAKGADRNGELCTHGGGCLDCRYPQRFRPEPWQVFQIANVFGWLTKRRGRWVRRFTKVYDEEARKNGKTFKLGGVGIYLAFVDGELGAEVYSAATKRDQAIKVWNAARMIIKKTPELRGLGVEIFGSDKPRSTPCMIHEGTASKFLPVGEDYDTEDGANVHGALIDEYHAHRSDGIVSVLETGMGARSEPLVWIITTAGDSLSSPCGLERDYAIKVLRGVVDDEAYFATIYDLDLDDEDGATPDDWMDEANWQKPNPNLGVSVFVETLRDEVKRSKDNPLRCANVKRKRFNIWASDPKTGWIPLQIWDRCTATVSDHDLLGEECFGGIDLASVLDTTSIALLFPPSKTRPLWSVRVQIFLPSSGMPERERKDRAPYRVWAKRGWVIITEGMGGEVADYSAVRDAMNDAAEKYRLVETGFDPWNAGEIMRQLQDEDGLRLVQLQQGFSNLSPPMKEFERLVRSRQVEHGGNQALRWAIDNVALVTDNKKNVMPNKKRSTGRIDPVVAIILAMNRALACEVRESIYNPGATATGRSIYNETA